MLLGLLFAALAAIFSGSGSVLQSLGIARADTPDGSVTALTALRHQPLYLAGLGIDIVGFVAAASALHRLPLFLVQSVVASSIGVTALITVFMGAKLGRVGWTALSFAGGGLVLLALSAQEGPSTPLPAFWHWVLLFGVIPIAGLGVLGDRIKGRWGAPMLGFAAGLCFTGVAVSARSLHAPPEIWQLLGQPNAWAIPVNGAAAAILFALALQRGAVTMISAVVFTTQTVVPSVIGLLVLGDNVREGFVPAAALGFLCAIGGAVTLAKYSAEHPVSAIPQESADGKDLAVRESTG